MRRSRKYRFFLVPGMPAHDQKKSRESYYGWSTERIPTDDHDTATPEEDRPC